MGGIRWDALPYVVAILGVDDVEHFIMQLTAIRDHQTKVSERG